MKEQLEGKKMTTPKLEVIRFQNEDVISASETSVGGTSTEQVGGNNGLED
ncbi:MAG: hypothetical protein IJQ33_00320 [Clostridia bacterium]|nr:hypothetical protein [Clostridia bacterium]